MMNKRIKKKVTKRALSKYHAGEELTHKEYKLIDTYIFVNELDIDEFAETLSKMVVRVRNTMADVFETIAKGLRVTDSNDN